MRDFLNGAIFMAAVCVWFMILIAGAVYIQREYGSLRTMIYAIGMISILGGGIWYTIRRVE